MEHQEEEEEVTNEDKKPRSVFLGER